MVKGIGITLVVIGHFQQPGHQYIFWFHMPLFFFVSGYLYNPRKTVKEYFFHKCNTLLVPYFMFLFLLSIPDYMYMIRSYTGENNNFYRPFLSFTLKQIYGGRNLYGWFDVFWFVTCLFLTQQLFHSIIRLTKKNHAPLVIIIACMYVYATVCTFFPFLRLPSFWGINSVPMALVFFFFGYLIHSKGIHLKGVSLLGTALFIAGMALSMGGIIHHDFNMKWDVYGLPALNILIALCGIFSVYALSLLVSYNSRLERVCIALGEASLVIMFCHQAFRQIIFSHIPFAVNDWLKLITVLAACSFLFFLLTVFPLTEQLFLGRRQQQHP